MAPAVQQSEKDGLASMLGTGVFSDILIVCGNGMTKFKAHKLTLCANSDFFNLMCKNTNFKEGLESVVELPEDKPSLSARLLIFCYTKTYAITNIAKTDSGVELGQFQDVVDDFDSSTSQSKGLLHAQMFTLADKYGVPKLIMKSRYHFVRDLVRRTSTGSTTEQLLASYDPIVRYVSSNTPATERSLQNVLIQAIKFKYHIGHSLRPSESFYSRLRSSLTTWLSSIYSRRSHSVRSAKVGAKSSYLPAKAMVE